jgi:hypothetical protein
MQRASLVGVRSVASFVRTTIHGWRTSLVDSHAPYVALRVHPVFGPTVASFVRTTIRALRASRVGWRSLPVGNHDYPLGNRAYPVGNRISPRLVRARIVFLRAPPPATYTTRPLAPRPVPLRRPREPPAVDSAIEGAHARRLEANPSDAPTLRTQPNIESRQLRSPSLQPLHGRLTDLPSHRPVVAGRDGSPNRPRPAPLTGASLAPPPRSAVRENGDPRATVQRRRRWNTSDNVATFTLVAGLPFNRIV